MPFDLTEFSRAIIDGELDDKLDQLEQVLRLRKNIHSQLKAIEFKIGDRVRFTQHVNPSYLRGKEATIRDKKTKRFVVDLDQRESRFFKGISCSPSMLEKIS